jgi:hypothetical protein
MIIVGVCKMTMIVIGQKDLFKNIKPLLIDTLSDKQIIFYQSHTLFGYKRNKILSAIRTACIEDTAAPLVLTTENSETARITALLKELPNKEVYYIPHYVYSRFSDITDLSGCLVPVDLEKPRLNYLEFQVTDHCNLNCKGCTHFSNLEEKEIFADLNTYISDIKRVKELFWGISTIRLMGGEPLLNPELWQFIRVTRTVFPDADIRIVTNGLLLPKTDESLFFAMRDTYSGFDVSPYIPTMKIMDKIRRTIRENNLELKMTSMGIGKSKHIDHFYKKLTLNPVNDSRRSFKKCEYYGCLFLRDGTISQCPVAKLIGKFNSAYNLHYPVNEGRNIYEKINPWELEQSLHNPIDFCAYCTEISQSFRWERCPRKKSMVEDWVVAESEIPMLKEEEQSPATTLVSKAGKALSHTPTIRYYISRLYKNMLYKNRLL